MKEYENNGLPEFLNMKTDKHNNLSIERTQEIERLAVPLLNKMLKKL